MPVFVSTSLCWLIACFVGLLIWRRRGRTAPRLTTAARVLHRKRFDAKRGNVESRGVSHFRPRKRPSASSGADGRSGSPQRFVRILPPKPLLHGIAYSCQTPGRRRRSAGRDGWGIYAPVSVSGAFSFSHLGDSNRH